MSQSGSSSQPQKQNPPQNQPQQELMEWIYRCLQELTSIAQRQNQPPQVNNAPNLRMYQECRMMNYLGNFSSKEYQHFWEILRPWKQRSGLEK